MHLAQPLCLPIAEDAAADAELVTAELARAGAAQADDSLEQALRKALDDDRLALHFQPQVELRNGRLVGFEALARWEDPALGVVPPSRFVAAAERSDLVIALGRWALRSACRQLAAWGRAGHRGLHVSVNLSGRHFRAEGIVAHVNQALTEFGVDPRRLQIEITENTLVGNVERAVEAMQRLAALGVRFAVDDFGTGYSSLSYLRRFPIHEIKIDRSFIAEMTERADDMAIVREGKLLGLAVLRLLRRHVPSIQTVDACRLSAFAPR